MYKEQLLITFSGFHPLNIRKTTHSWFLNWSSNTNSVSKLFIDWRREKQSLSTKIHPSICLKALFYLYKIFSHRYWSVQIESVALPITIRTFVNRSINRLTTVFFRTFKVYLFSFYRMFIEKNKLILRDA
jgi:hypothetical protein